MTEGIIVNTPAGEMVNVRDSELCCCRHLIVSKLHLADGLDNT